MTRSCITLVAVAAATTAHAGIARGDAGQLTAAAGAGAIHLDKVTPLELDTTSAIVKLEGGRQLTGATTAKLRIEGFRADGINVALTIVGEVHPWAWGGFTMAAGASFGARSALGNLIGAGAFARVEVTPGVFARADLFGSAALRNDFGGTGVGLTAGVEYRWRP